MECSVREGVRAMKGMWKTLAERLGMVLAMRFKVGYGKKRGGDLPVAYDADFELLAGHV
jgi:hypothetical protein